MSQHFLISTAINALSLVKVMRMSDGEAKATFGADPGCRGFERMLMALPWRWRHSVQ